MENGKKFIVIIDDSKLDCFIAEKMAKKIRKAADPEDMIVTRSFLDPKEALAFIKENPLPKDRETFIIVDDHMPTMSGIRFIEIFRIMEKERPELGACRICLVGSSIKESDREIERKEAARLDASSEWKPLDLIKLKKILDIE